MNVACKARCNTLETGWCLWWWYVHNWELFHVKLGSLPWLPICSWSSSDKHPMVTYSHIIHIFFVETKIPAATSPFNSTLRLVNSLFHIFHIFSIYYIIYSTFSTYFPYNFHILYYIFHIFHIFSIYYIIYSMYSIYFPYIFHILYYIFHI